MGLTHLNAARPREKVEWGPALREFENFVGSRFTPACNTSLVDPALRASKVLRQQHAARDADRYEWPQVIILDRADSGEEVKEEERQANAKPMLTCPRVF